MSEPLVSILTPFKNSASYISECITSILNQSYQNWELIIVNDHSTDDSNSIVSEFAEKDSRIHLFQNQSLGIIPALRLAFEKSSGRFITRMDSDDIMASQKLEVMVGNLLKYGPKHIALGAVNYFCSGKLGNGYADYEKWLNSLTKKGDNYSEIYKECVIPSPCWMVYREDLEACGGFDSDVYPEDYDLAFRFYKNRMKCIPTTEILHHWRDYNTRTSRTHDHYKDNHFLNLKLSFFLEIDYNSHRPLVLWGAGLKGKFCAKFFRKKNIPFLWICNNPKKIGKIIYKTKMHSPQSLQTLSQPQVLVTVANKVSQNHIACALKAKNLVKAKDYFFFC